MFNIDGWNWAHYTYWILVLIALVGNARKSWTNLGIYIFTVSIQIALMYFGGFFRGF